MNKFGNPIARKSGLVVQELRDEVLIYDTTRDKAHCLNHTAAIVWKACDGSNSVADITTMFEEHGQPQVADDIVWLAIDQLDQFGLLEEKLAPRSDTRSRRQVIKTLALGTAVALPVIATLVAPPNAMASVSCACPSPGNPNSCQIMTGCPSITNCNPAGLCAPNPIIT